jgi:hypothetical protein
MNKVMESSTTNLFTLIVIALLLSGCHRGEPENRYTGEDFNPVYPDMLVDCQYAGRAGGSKYDDLKWTFDETSFEIIAGAIGMPSDLAETLLPPGTTAERITGAWQVANGPGTVRRKMGW